MGKGKPHIEFLKIDMDDGWEVPEGYPDSFTQKILAMDIEEDNQDRQPLALPQDRAGRLFHRTLRP